MKLVEKLKILSYEYKKNKNDKKIFDELFKYTYYYLYNYAKAKNLNHEDIEDLLQEYFINDFEIAIDKFNEKQNKHIKNYLLEIFHFRVINFYKKNKRREEIFKDNFINNPNSVKESYIDNNLFNEIIFNEIRKILYDTIDKIENVEQKKVLVLKLCLPFNLSFKELCELIEMKVESARIYLSRGIKNLKELLNNELSTYNISISTINSFLKRDKLSINEDILGKILNQEEKDIFDSIFYKNNNKLNISKIANEKGIDENIAKNLIKDSIKKIISVPVNNFRSNNMEDKFKFDSNGDIDINPDKILDFIDNYSSDKNFRNTTGNQEIDGLLNAYLGAFRDIKDPSILSFADYIEKLNIDYDSLMLDLDLTMTDINNLITDKADEELVNKVMEYINNHSEENNFEEIGDSVDLKFNKCIDNFYRIKRT